jgi:hypothetical protein
VKRRRRRRQKERKRKGERKKKKEMTTVGLEPTTPGTVDRKIYYGYCKVRGKKRKDKMLH